MLIFWIAVFLVSTFVLIKSADYFTKYSEKLGLIFGMSSFIIGATIVAVGTSLPELVSSLYAVIEAGSSEFVVDTIVGSNIANALLILGLGAVFARTLKVSTSLIDIDLPFFFLSLGTFVLFAADRQITWQEGVMLLIFFIIFVVYNMKAKPHEQDVEEMADIKQQHEELVERGSKRQRVVRYSFFVLIAMALIALSSKYFIDSILMVSEIAGISSSILVITVVSFGTSLPEILTSISAIKRGNHGIAIGNIFGSNTFNIALIGGVPAFFGTLAIDEQTFALGIPFLVIATFAAIFSTFDNKVQVWEGIAMLFMYIVFIGKITGFV